MALDGGFEVETEREVLCSQSRGRLLFTVTRPSQAWPVSLLMGFRPYLLDLDASCIHVGVCAPCTVYSIRAMVLSAATPTRPRPHNYRHWVDSRLTLMFKRWFE